MDEPTGNESQGLTESEVEAIVGRAMDSRTAPILERLSQMPDQSTALAELRTSILGDVTKLLDERRTQPVNEAGLLSQVEKMLDNKLARISTGSSSRPAGGVLSRWLGLA